jgi:hypothetical protein
LCGKGVIELFTIVEVRRLDKKNGSRIDIDLSGRDRSLSLLAGSGQFAVKWVEWLNRFVCSHSSLASIYHTPHVGDAHDV